MHSVRTDRINRMIEQRISGTPDVAEIEAAGVAARKAVQSLGAAPGTHVSLYDLSGVQAISDEVIDSAMKQWADPRYTIVRARKVALVAPSAIARLKLNRPATSRDNMRLFADRGEAMRWLFS